MSAFGRLRTVISVVVAFIAAWVGGTLLTAAVEVGARNAGAPLPPVAIEAVPLLAAFAGAAYVMGVFD